LKANDSAPAENKDTFIDISILLNPEFKDEHNFFEALNKWIVWEKEVA
jgi:hypothetical protein